MGLSDLHGLVLFHDGILSVGVEEEFVLVVPGGPDDLGDLLPRVGEDLVEVGDGPRVPDAHEMVYSMTGLSGPLELDLVAAVGGGDEKAARDFADPVRLGLVFAGVHVEDAAGEGLDEGIGPFVHGVGRHAVGGGLLVGVYGLDGEVVLVHRPDDGFLHLLGPADEGGAFGGLPHVEAHAPVEAFENRVGGKHRVVAGPPGDDHVRSLFQGVHDLFHSHAGRDVGGVVKDVVRQGEGRPQGFRCPFPHPLPESLHGYLGVDEGHGEGLHLPFLRHGADDVTIKVDPPVRAGGAA